MRYIEIDVPHLAVAPPDDQHFLWRLHEKHHRWRDTAKNVPFRNAARVTAFARHERYFAGAHLVIVALHLRAHPGLQNVIARLGSAKARIGGGTAVAGLAE